MKNPSPVMPRLFVILSLSFGLALLANIGAGLSAQNPGGSPEAKKKVNTVKSSPESIAAGQKLYTKNCSFCHGMEAKGDGKLAPKDTHPADLTDAKWERGSSDGEIYAVIAEGAGPKFDMKGFKSKMTEEDIWNVVNYIRSLGPKTAAK